MSSVFAKSRRNRQIERAFGPADPKEVLELIGSDALDLLGKAQVLTLLARLEECLHRHPLSHNLRLFTIKVYRSVGRLREQDQLLATSIALYPESPLLLCELLNARGRSLTQAERTELESREAELRRRTGLPPAKNVVS